LIIEAVSGLTRIVVFCSRSLAISTLLDAPSVSLVGLFIMNDTAAQTGT